MTLAGGRGTRRARDIYVLTYIGPYIGPYLGHYFGPYFPFGVGWGGVHVVLLLFISMPKADRSEGPSLQNRAAKQGPK